MERLYIKVEEELDIADRILSFNLMRSPDLVDWVEVCNPTLITASPPQSWCDRPIELCLVSRYLLIHKQGLDSTQPNLQREAIALVPIQGVIQHI